MAEKLRVIMIGQNHALTFACLQALAAHHHIVGIVESAPRDWHPSTFAKTRLRTERIVKRTLGMTQLHTYAKQHQLPYYFMTSGASPDLAEFIGEQSPDIGCVASISHLLSGQILSIPPLGFLNVHPSLLPQYRGPNPLFWHYYELRETAGVTVHKMDEGEDTGDIVRQSSFSLPLHTPPTEFVATAAKLGAELLVHALADIAMSMENIVVQKHLPCPRRASNFHQSDLVLRWSNWSAEEARHILSAILYWYPDKFSALVKFNLWRWKVGGITYEPHDVAPGTLQRDQTGYYVAHEEGKIRLVRALSLYRILKTLITKNGGINHHGNAIGTRRLDRI